MQVFVMANALAVFVGAKFVALTAAIVTSFHCVTMLSAIAFEIGNIEIETFA